MRCTVILPTYNEAANIKNIITLILKRGISDLDILVVDDNSPDGTARIVEDLMSKQIHLLLNKKKKGLGHAYMLGMEYAIRKLNSDILIQMDADLSHSPVYLPRMMQEIKRYDIVIGSRYINGGSIPAGWGLHRKILSIWGNRIISMFLGSKVKDWSTGYRVIKKEVYARIRKDIGDDMLQGYAFQIGFLDKALKAGFSVKEVPIHFEDRKKGVSKLGLEYLINTIKYIFRTRLVR